MLQMSSLRGAEGIEVPCRVRLQEVAAWCQDHMISNKALRMKQGA
jgi:hypothetical protein